MYSTTFDDATVDGMSESLDGTTSGDDVVEYGDLDGIARGDATCEIAETVEELVVTVFLLNLYSNEVACCRWQLAFFAERHEGLDVVGDSHYRRSKEETAALYSDNVGCGGETIDLGDE